MTAQWLSLQNGVMYIAADAHKTVKEKINSYKNSSS